MKILGINSQKNDSSEADPLHQESSVLDTLFGLDGNDRLAGTPDNERPQGDGDPDWLEVDRGDETCYSILAFPFTTNAEREAAIRQEAGRNSATETDIF